MARDAQDKARERLSVLAQDSAAEWRPARRLEQDAGLLGRLLAAAADHHDGQSSAGLDDVGAALGLFEDMRLSLDQIEAHVVMEARRRGMEWRQIADYQGLKSSQAASQRYQRLMTRLEEIRRGIR